MLKRFLSFIFIIGIPLTSFLFRLGVSLTGGHRIPLAWAFSYYAALSISFIFAFTFANIKTRLKNKLKVALFTVFLSIILGTAFGYGFSQAGVLGGVGYGDPSKGNVPLLDSFICAVLGAFGGLGLGLVTGLWLGDLTDMGMDLNFALIVCLSIAILSISFGMSVSLFLW